MNELMQKQNGRPDADATICTDARPHLAAQASDRQGYSQSYVAHLTHLDPFPVAVLLLEGDEASVDILGLGPRDVVEGILVYCPSPIPFANLLLELGELDEELLLSA